MYISIFFLNDKNHDILDNFKTITQYRFYSYKEYVKDDIMSLYPYYNTNTFFIFPLQPVFGNIALQTRN